MGRNPRRKVQEGSVIEILNPTRRWSEAIDGSFLHPPPLTGVLPPSSSTPPPTNNFPLPHPPYPDLSFSESTVGRGVIEGGRGGGGEFHYIRAYVEHRLGRYRGRCEEEKGKGNGG